ncbi:MAG TPA: 2-amino-4-hydroxy-6-hydroxymethyldihydropteridine diphosphokinase [Candidatus Acidoferrales bacterium]|jgi:2-amino-4-hydroxy-6-hydroxymethyldihydropteridine diphosphokinase|nr:2-amino-4-hydroxy-6-hydroxymethyldihydropteridine diphosphokinase [Candidatus Acidoferrales bacterium]
MITVYIALGTNVGEREANLLQALQLLPESGVHIRRVSSIYETEPVDYLDQEWFLNAVLEAQTELDALDLLSALRVIEARMGSKKAFAKGPRKIDLDILLYGDETIDTPELQVPHPHMLERKFVLIPLAEIAPNLRHPSWKSGVPQLLAATPDRSAVKKLHDAPTI